MAGGESERSVQAATDSSSQILLCRGLWDRAALPRSLRSAWAHVSTRGRGSLWLEGLPASGRLWSGRGQTPSTLHGALPGDVLVQVCRKASSPLVTSFGKALKKFYKEAPSCVLHTDPSPCAQGALGSSLKGLGHRPEGPPRAMGCVMPNPRPLPTLPPPRRRFLFRGKCPRGVEFCSFRVALLYLDFWGPLGMGGPTDHSFTEATQVTATIGEGLTLCSWNGLSVMCHPI